MTQLKPCPFCGSTRVDQLTHISALADFVHCNNCCTQGPFHNDDPAAARDAWNTRAALKPATIEEGLRDYAMFGKFVAKAAPVFYRGDKLTDFIAVWGHPEPYRFIGMFPEFVAFVKSELGLE